MKASVKMMFFPGNGPAKLLVAFPMSGINTAVSDHFEMLLRDMADQTLYKLHDRDGFFHILIILMTVVMEGNKVTIVFVNAGGGDYRTAEIAADILDGSFRVTGIGLGINIEAVFVFAVAAGFHLFERRTDVSLQFIQECGTKGVSQISIVEMTGPAPEAIVAVTALGNQAMDMGVPFEIPAEGMKDHDETGSEVHRLILFKKHAGNNTVYGMEKTAKERAVFEKKVPKLFVNGKDTMAVGDVNELKGHRGSAIHSIFVPTGRTKAAVTAKRNKLEITAVRAGVHSAAK